MLEVLFICIESITSIVCFVMQFFSEIFWYYFKSTIRHSELGTRTQGINSRQALNQNKGKNKGTWKLLSDNILLLLTYFDIVKIMNLYFILYMYSLVSLFSVCRYPSISHRLKGNQKGNQSCPFILTLSCNCALIIVVLLLPHFAINIHYLFFNYLPRCTYHLLYSN